MGLLIGVRFISFQSHYPTIRLYSDDVRKASTVEWCEATHTHTHKGFQNHQSKEPGPHGWRNLDCYVWVSAQQTDGVQSDYPIKNIPFIIRCPVLLAGGARLERMWRTQHGSRALRSVGRRAAASRRDEMGRVQMSTVPGWSM